MEDAEPDNFANEPADDDNARRKLLKRRELLHGTRFITFSCEHRLPLLGNPLIRDVFVESLARTRSKFSFDLHAWVVMPEHVHFMARKLETPLGVVLSFLKMSVTERVLRRWRALQAPLLDKIRRPDGSLRFWLKGGGFDRNCRGEAEAARTICYIHRNPVCRELVKLPQDWKWSSVRWWMGDRTGPLECQMPASPAAWNRWKGYM